MKEIPLTQEKVVLVDDEDYEWLSQYNWYAHCDSWGINWYAVRKEHGQDVIMHRVILNALPEQEIDHRDRNGLNNQKYNLRFATPQQNRANQRKRLSGKSNFQGVYFYSNRNKPWRAQISYSGIRNHIGYFESEEDAARAYDEIAQEIFGEFAGLNFPEKTF